MTKFGQAEYSDFMAKVFADKLDEILETAETIYSGTQCLVQRRSDRCYQYEKHSGCIQLSVFKRRCMRRF